MKEAKRPGLWALLGNNPYPQMLSTAWRYAKGMRGRYLLIYAMFITVNVLVSLQPVIFGYFINYLQEGEGDLLTAAWIYGGAHLALILGFWVFQWPARLMERRMAYDISRRLLLETYDRVVHLPLAWHREHHSGDTINRTRKAYEALKAFFDDGFIYFQTLVRMFISMVAILWFSAVFGGIAGAVGVVIVLAILVFDKPIILATKETNERENDLLAGLSDNLGNIITVTTLRLGKRTAERISERIGRVWPPFLRNVQLNEQKWFTTGVLIGIMYAAITIGYVYQNYVPGEIFLVGGLVTLLGYVSQFANMFNSLTAQYNTVVRLRADLAAIDPITAAWERQHRPDLPGENSLQRAWSTLAVNHLSFRYDPGAEDGKGLSDVNLTLDRGRRIALIGPSGSGKTTLLYNLRGLYPAEHLELAFGEHGTRDPAHLYEQTTLIPQTPEVFEDSILNNLTMGLDRTDDELAQAIHLAALSDVVEQAPDGLATHLSEGGANLSGGQRQRLSIARGLLAADTSSLLLLDEPTSSLDPHTESLVYGRIFAAFPDKTIISTLHRLHLLRQFDYIYYLEEGRVLAEGTLEELLVANFAFKRLWEEQVEG